MKIFTVDEHHGWMPLVWLAYLVFFFVHPVADRVGTREWVATLLAVAVFLPLYFFTYRAARPWCYFTVAGIALLGLGFAPSNPGAACFVIYAAAFLPFIVDSELAAVALLAGLVALVGIEARVLHLPLGFTIPAVFFSVLISVGNIFFAQRARSLEKLKMAHTEIEFLAKVAERERIARDLHDVLGHTLSLITLKSELAGKLIDSHPAQAKAEIADVEHTARQALAEVRQAIGGYRTTGIEEEFRHAKATLETAGVKVECQRAPLTLPPTQESVLALALRESVTNVLRHAHAQHCQLRLDQSNGHCRLQVHDDGRGGSQVEGNGLRGMRERVEALGGSLARDTSAGTRVTILLPVTAETKVVSA